METRPKLLQRKLREQPQQHLMHPPGLTENKLEAEEDFDRWRVINMQYQALFKKKSEISFDDRQISRITAEPIEKKPAVKPNRTPDNRIDQQYLTQKLLDFEQSQQARIKRPALLIQSTDELLRQLPKGESLLEEAEMLVSTKGETKTNYEDSLRDTIDSLHIKQIQKMESVYIETYNDLCKEIEDYELFNSELEQKIRKFSMQASSEKEEIEEIRKHNEKVKDLEEKREDAHRENLLMEETISLLQRDINETVTLFKDQQEILVKDIEMSKQKVTEIDNQKVESMEKECKELFKENLELEQEIEKIEKLWKGDVTDVKKIMEEIDENINIIKKELKEIVISRSVVQQERQAVNKKIRSLEQSRVVYLKNIEESEHKNPRNLYIYLDNILTDTSRKVRMLLKDEYKKDPENTIKLQIEKLFSPSKSTEDLNPILKLKRDTLCFLKDKHDSQAFHTEKDTSKEVAEMLSKCKKVENVAISKSLSEISKLSPIRKISPARESSFSSLARLRDITDKVLKPKHKRIPSNSSRGSRNSIDTSSADDRKSEYQRYLKITNKT